MPCVLMYEWAAGTVQHSMIAFMMRLSIGPTASESPLKKLKLGAHNSKSVKKQNILLSLKRRKSMSKLVKKTSSVSPHLVSPSPGNATNLINPEIFQTSQAPDVLEKTSTDTKQPDSPPIRTDTATNLAASSKLFAHISGSRFTFTASLLSLSLFTKRFSDYLSYSFIGRQFLILLVLFTTCRFRRSTHAGC